MEREHSGAGTAMLSLAEYAELDDPDDGYVTELVRGTVVREPRPRHRHGEVQAELTFHLKAWAKAHGATVTVESGYVLSDEPPTVRGPDVAVTVEPRPGRNEPGGWPAVTRPRYGYPRMYCALWIGPMPVQLAATGPDDPAPRRNTLCDDPVRFEAWVAGAAGGR